MTINSCPPIRRQRAEGQTAVEQTKPGKDFFVLALLTAGRPAGKRQLSRQNREKTFLFWRAWILSFRAVGSTGGSGRDKIGKRLVSFHLPHEAPGPVGRRADTRHTHNAQRTGRAVGLTTKKPESVRVQTHKTQITKTGRQTCFNCAVSHYVMFSFFLFGPGKRKKRNANIVIFPYRAFCARFLRPGP